MDNDYEFLRRTGLTPQEASFVVELCIDFDHYRAYNSVYDTGENPDDDPEALGLVLANKPKIKLALYKLIERHAKDVIVSREVLISLSMKIVLSASTKPADKLRALALVAKLSGNLTDNKNMETPSVVLKLMDSQGQVTHERTLEGVVIDGKAVIPDLEVINERK